MKIRHNIKRNWKILSGRILETIFGEWEKRWDIKRYCTKDWFFCIRSVNIPDLNNYHLYVFWKNKNKDNNYLEYEYDTERKAQQFLDYINEFTIEDNEIKNKDLVWVSNIKQKYADEDFIENANYHYIWKGINWGFVCEDKNWDYVSWRFVSNKKSKTREMTLEQVCEELWETIKIIK